MLDQLLIIILLHKNKLESLLRPCVFHLRKVQCIFLVHRRTNFVRGFKLIRMYVISILLLVYKPSRANSRRFVKKKIDIHEKEEKIVLSNSVTYSIYGYSEISEK